MQTSRSARAPPPDAANHSQAEQGPHPPRYSSHHHDPPFTASSAEEPPPSYEDATHSTTAPLLVGPRTDYGAFRAYVDPDDSSEASSEVDDTEQYMPERVGQTFALLVLVALLYVFWTTINQPDPDDFLH